MLPHDEIPSVDGMVVGTYYQRKASHIEQKEAPQDVVVDVNQAWNCEEVLELIGFGRAQLIIVLTSGLLLMVVVTESMGMSIITLSSQCDFALTSVDKAVMGAACFVGILSSSYFWGYLSDTIGRRVILLYCTFIGNVVSLVSVFIPHYWTFVFLRFVVGVFLAGASSTTYAYLGEFLIARWRPMVINYASMFVGGATVYVPTIAWLILSMDWTFDLTESFAFRPWRLLIVANLLPGLLAVLIFLILPESPKMLLCLRQEAEALAAVDWICKLNTGRSLAELKVHKLQFESQMQPETLLTTTKTGSSALKRMWQETVPLFKKPHLMNFCISCIIMCGLFVSSAGMALWYPEIQNRLGAHTSEELLTVCQVIDASIEQQTQNGTDLLMQSCDDTISTKTFIDSTILGVCYTLGYVVLGLVINPLGRKLLIIGALCISGLCSIALHWLLDPIAIVVCFCLFLVLPGLCISVLSGAVVDLVPTHLRGKAVCICLMLGRSGSIIGSNIIGVLLESYCGLTFGVFTAYVFVSAVLTLLLPI